MSASGVDKSKLREVGTEILLVTGYDPATGVMRLSVPPDVRPRRVSVDAIEHLTIYREHPEVGGILHVHGWMAGAVSTETSTPAARRSWRWRSPSWCDRRPIRRAPSSASRTTA